MSGVLVLYRCHCQCRHIRKAARAVIFIELRASTIISTLALFVCAMCVLMVCSAALRTQNPNSAGSARMECVDVSAGRLFRWSIPIQASFKINDFHSFRRFFFCSLSISLFLSPPSHHSFFSISLTTHLVVSESFAFRICLCFVSVLCAFHIDAFVRSQFLGFNSMARR